MTSLHIPSHVDNFESRQAYSSFMPQDENVRNHNAIPKGFIGPSSASFDSDFAANEKAEWQKSPSGHSVASSTTSDSGFQSVTMLGTGTLSRSSNSAFSPRSPVKLDMSKATLGSSEISEAMSEISDIPPPAQYDTEYRSSSPVDNNIAFVGNYDMESAPAKDAFVSRNRDLQDFQDNAESYQRVLSYSTMPRSLRRKKYAAQGTRHVSETVASFISSENSENNTKTSVLKSKPSTKSRSDALLKNFVEQAEERDRKARREQRSITRSGRPRARSSSANKNSTGRSSSVSSEGRSFTVLKRSNSAVDMQKIIGQAESRDRHARVDQARLKGIIPPRRHLPAKDQVRIVKRTTAESIIQKYEEKKQEDDPFLKHAGDTGSIVGRKNSFTSYGQGYLPSDTNSEYAVPSHTTVNDYKSYRTSQSSQYKKSPSSIHSDAGVNYTVARYVPRYREYKKRTVGDSDDERDHKTPISRSSNQAPRTAMSMGNLQHTENDGSKSRALADWQKSWEAKMAHSTYQRNRAKSSSTAALTSSSSVENRSSNDNQHSRRKQVESLITGHVSPRQHDTLSLPKSTTENLARTRQGAQQHSIDSSNYEQLPPPPTPPPESPLNSKSPDSQSSKTDSPRDCYDQPLPKNQKKNARLSSPKYSHTMGRPVDTRPAEPSPKASPIPQPEKYRSSTLPRHFKSGSAWDGDAKQKAVQEQLNALRDEEIDELSVRIDTLSTLEKSRLNNLLKERDFQRRVEEESRRTFSDEDISDEGYEVPDRPDRDRLIQLQDDHAGQVDALRDQEEELRREEERERKRQLERERREEEERERQLRARLDRERRSEEEEQLRKEDELRRFEEDKARKNEERRLYEEDRTRRERQLRRMEEEKMRKEEERMKREEMEKERREEERIKLENERMRKEKEEQERQRREWLMEERERREQEEKQRAKHFQLQRESEEREREAERRQDELESNQRTFRGIQRTAEEDEKEEAERELLEKKLSMGKPSNFPKFSRPSEYGPASVYGRHTSTSGSTYQPPTANKPKMRPKVDRAPRPVSDGYFLGKTNHLPDKKDLKTSQNSTSNFNVSTSPTSPSGNQRTPGSYSSSHSNPRVIGTHERYRDPRDKREAAIKREQSLKRRQQEPSYLTFKDRQRLFSAGRDSPINKPKASKTLLEIESTLRRNQMS